MINAMQVLERMQFNTTSHIRAIQEVRDYVGVADDKLKAAITVIHALTGEDVSYDDEKFALHVAQGVVERVIRQGESFHPQYAVKDAEETATKLRANPAMQWLNVQPAAEGETPFGPSKTVAGVNLTIKANGKIKKGGKQEAVVALFKDHVVAKNVSNADFIKIVMSELDMSKAGATTYAYNARKAVELETGQPVNVIKSKKGRKPKV
jgi:hypothetical protein